MIYDSIKKKNFFSAQTFFPFADIFYVIFEMTGSDSERRGNKLKSVIDCCLHYKILTVEMSSTAALKSTRFVISSAFPVKKF